MYNKRSAMYEKAGDVDKSMADIMVLLTLNKTHGKGRIRRARILEAQGKLRDALKELCIVLAQLKDDAMAGKQVRCALRKHETLQRMLIHVLLLIPPDSRHDHRSCQT